MTAEQPPVLIVGGGGAGLTASMLLSQLGVESALVSAWPGTSILPKAHVLNQRTMEILRDLDLAEQIYAAGCPLEHMTHSGWYAGVAGPDEEYGRRIAQVEAWGNGGKNPDWVAASALHSTNLPQIRLEPHLKARAEQLAPGRVRFNHELIGFEQDEDGVTATIRDKDANRSYDVRARYLLACDGGRTVGPALGVAMEGMRDVARMVTFHIGADLSRWVRDPGVLIRWVQLPHTGTGAVLVPMGPDRWGPDSEEWVFHLQYAPDDARAHDDAAVLSDMRAALGVGEHPIEVHYISRWSVEGVVANRFRDGRVFLLGDAAHRHPPTGGLGLNSAIQDAHNIAWKLAAVLGGHAGERLLDSYEPERRPVTANNVQRSLENALNHLVIGQQMGVSPDNHAEQNWAALRRLWSDEDTDAEFRRTVQRAIATQSMEFNELNVEYGFTYDSPAVVADGSPPPDPVDPIRVYQPSARPGHPLPHAWLDDHDGHRLPIMDLVRPGRFLLIAGEDGQDWCDAAAKLTAVHDLPFDALRIGHLDGDYLDPRSTWTRLRGHTSRGAVLVRPDRFIGWRADDSAEDPAAELAAATSRLLAR